jgi:hypothetical protein
MCPACLSVAAWTLVGAASAGGGVGLMTWFRWGRRAQPQKGEKDDDAPNRHP